MILVTSPIVINLLTRGQLAAKTRSSFVFVRLIRNNEKNICKQ